jgi:hypothetical protein
MFGNTQNDVLDAGGAASQPDSMRPPPSFLENVISSGVSGAMGHNSEIGSVYLGQRFLHDQTEAIRAHDPDFAASLKNHYGALPDVENGMFSGNPEIGTFAAHLAGANPKQDLVDTIESQHKIEEWKRNHPEAADVPSINQGIAQVKNQQDIVDQEAQEAEQRASGVNIPGVGKVTGSGLLGGITASFAPSNPAQAAFNIALAGTGGISKDIIANMGSRITANAVSNGVLSAVSQSVLAAPAAEQYGVERDYKQEAFGVLTNTLLGGMLSGVHEIGEHYLPATTVKGMGEVRDAVDGAAKQSGVVGDAVRELSAAKTPDEASAIAANLPLETRLDVLHEVNPKPSAETRGVIQAGERDLLLENGFKEANIEYPDGIQHADKVEKAIEAGKPIPETPQSGMAKTAGSGVLKVEKTADSMDNVPLPSTQEPQKPKVPIIKKPIRAWLQRQGGVRAGSNLAGELKNMGIRKPGLIRTLGRLGDVDNIPHEEWVKEFGHAPTDETGNYVSKQHILDEIEKEQKGISNNAEKSTGVEAGSHEDLERYAEEHGVETGDKSVDDVLKEIKDQQEQLEWARIADEEKESIGAREAEREALDQETQIKYDALAEKVMPTEKTAAGEQGVIPGAEKISEKSLAERVMSRLMKSNKEQKPANEGLFDTGAQKQDELFKDVKPDSAAPIDDDKQTTVKDAIKEIKDHEDLFKAMTTCMIG